MHQRPGGGGPAGSHPAAGTAPRPAEERRFSPQSKGLRLAEKVGGSDRPRPRRSRLGAGGFHTDLAFPDPGPGEVVLNGSESSEVESAFLVLGGCKGEALSQGAAPDQTAGQMLGEDDEGAQGVDAAGARQGLKTGPGRGWEAVVEAHDFGAGAEAGGAWVVFHGMGRGWV